MCEHFVARAAEPFALRTLWPFVERLEHWGIAGFGWGAAWTKPGGGLAVHRDVRAFRDDPEREGIGRQRTTAVLVHLRRPSRLATLTLSDTQPFDDPSGRFAFSHNGDLRDFEPWRRRYLAAGRIHGRADTEVGARWLEDRWSPGADAGGLLTELHTCFAGRANLATLGADGQAHHYAGNEENPVFTFRLGPIGIASTGVYSIDRSLFRFVAPDATDRGVVRLGRTVALAEDGSPSIVGAEAGANTPGGNGAVVSAS